MLLRAHGGPVSKCAPAGSEAHRGLPRSGDRGRRGQNVNVNAHPPLQRPSLQARTKLPHCPNTGTFSAQDPSIS